LTLDAPGGENASRLDIAGSCDSTGNELGEGGDGKFRNSGLVRCAAKTQREKKSENKAGMKSGWGPSNLFAWKLEIRG